MATQGKANAITPAAVASSSNTPAYGASTPKQASATDAVGTEDEQEVLSVSPEEDSDSDLVNKMDHGQEADENGVDGMGDDQEEETHDDGEEVDNDQEEVGGNQGGEDGKEANMNDDQEGDMEDDRDEEFEDDQEGEAEDDREEEMDSDQEEKMDDRGGEVEDDQEREMGGGEEINNGQDEGHTEPEITEADIQGMTVSERATVLDLEICCWSCSVVSVKGM